MTAAEPIKQPYFCSVSKSSGIWFIVAGKIPPDAPPGRYAYKRCPGSIPPQYSSISSCTVIPAGASLTPGLQTRPLTLKLRKPFLPFRPKELNHSGPRSRISLTQYRVSKLCSRVGRPNNPTWAI